MLVILFLKLRNFMIPARDRPGRNPVDVGKFESGESGLLMAAAPASVPAHRYLA